MISEKLSKSNTKPINEREVDRPDVYKILMDNKYVEKEITKFVI